jgi:hypothetical protein
MLGITASGMFFQPEVVTSCTSSFPLTSTTFHKDKELE